jgi:hypothetical protein
MRQGSADVGGARAPGVLVAREGAFHVFGGTSGAAGTSPASPRSSILAERGTRGL